MFILRLIPAGLLLLPFFLFSQTDENEVLVRKCGHDDYMHKLMQEDPDFIERRQQLEYEMQQWIKNNPEVLTGQHKEIITIPVVVHVLFRTTAENISHTRILEQIEVLNNDFSKMNSDWTNTPSAFVNRVANIEFHFCLAQQDPQGNWTNGVTRRQVTKTSFTYNDDNIIKSTALGGQTIWDRNRYLNLWVVNLSGGVLGYTQPPGGPASRDGIVIGYKYFGVTGATNPFNKGRTATHEIGHWFNLIHIWGDDGGACWGSDYVQDTPNQASEFYGCPSYPQMDICTPDSPGVMFMNYMDYVNDACMFMFTNGQKTRMLSALNVYRSLLKTSEGCNPATGIENIPVISDLTIFPNPGAGLFNFEMLLTVVTDVRLSLYNTIGQRVWEKSLNGVSVINETLNLMHLDPGVYILNINTGEEQITRRLIIQ